MEKETEIIERVKCLANKLTEVSTAEDCYAIRGALADLAKMKSKGKKAEVARNNPMTEMGLRD